MTTYTLAFMFDPDHPLISLQRKTHPPFLAGKLNGYGGECLPGESAAQCVRREVMEEACVNLSEAYHFCTFNRGHKWRIELFAAWVKPEKINPNATQEHQVVLKLSDAWAGNPDLADGVDWMVPMGLLSLNLVRQNPPFRISAGVNFVS